MDCYPSSFNIVPCEGYYRYVCYSSGGSEKFVHVGQCAYVLVTSDRNRTPFRVFPLMSICIVSFDVNILDDASKLNFPILTSKLRRVRRNYRGSEVWIAINLWLIVMWACTSVKA